MKIVTQKQRLSALEYTAELLRKDGWIQTRTVEQWLDDAEYRATQFRNALGALEVLNLLGFSNELVVAHEAVA